MKRPYEEHLPEDLHGIASKLREHRAEIDPLALDQIKQRALAKSTTSSGRRTFMKTRLATIFTALALVGGSGAALAVSTVGSHPNTHGGAADAQYKPGKGCGDKNHKHRHKHGRQCKKHHHRRHHGPNPPAATNCGDFDHDHDIDCKDSDGDFDGDLTRAIAAFSTSLRSF